MAIFINSPEWFQGIDSIIELLSLCVAFVIAWYGYKIYKLSSQKKYKYFSIGFLLIGISYIFEALSEIAVYNKYVAQKIVGPFLISRTVIEPITWIHTYSTTIFRLLLLFAFMILVLVTLDIKNKPTIILLTYFILLVTFVSMYAHMLFYITLLFLIGLLLVHYYHNYIKLKTCQSMFVAIAFLTIFVSNFVLTFMMYDPNIYVAGEAFQLTGFGILLYAFILVKRNDKPKKQA
jgi:hypothetical protein